MDQPPMLLHNIGSSTQGSKWRELVVPQKPQGGTIKGNGVNSKNQSAIVNESEKRPQKTPLEFKKGKKRENSMRDLKTDTRGYT